MAGVLFKPERFDVDQPHDASVVGMVQFVMRLLTIARRG